MKIDLLKPLEKVPYFTIAGFKQVLNADESDAQRVREMLSRWVKKGHIIRLKKGVYMTRRFYELHQNHASFTPAVSAIILPLYTDFLQEIFFGVIFNQASVAKALFDYFYLRPLPRSLRTHSMNLAEDLRLNLDELSSEVKDEFASYINLSNSPKMVYILDNLRRTIWRH